MRAFVDHTTKVTNMEEAATEARPFASTCFEELHDRLLERQALMKKAPLEKGVAEAIGDAHQAFPALLPRVF